MKWIMGLMFLLLAACVSRYPVSTINAGSSVHLKGPGTECTAISIGDGAVLAAAHCVLPFGIYIEGRPVVLQWINRISDVALFQVMDFDGVPFSPLACREPQVGEDVVMISDIAWATDIYTFGKVAKEVHIQSNGQALLLLDLVAAFGNSGAPVYDTDGYVIGMTIGRVAEYGNMAIAVPGNRLCELIAGDGKFSLPSSPS